jgi:predicted RNA-binding Zn-ribbon protein involved in translation (DUF1610 family)
MTKIWIVEGEHPTVTGRPQFIFSDEKMAQDKALDLLNIIRKNWLVALEPVTEFGDYKRFDEAVEETERAASGALNVYVSIDEHTLIEPDKACTTKPVCPKCGSDHIWIDAAARWDASISDWSLSGTHDTLGCQGCGWEGETAEWVEVEKV